MMIFFTGNLIHRTYTIWNTTLNATEQQKGRVMDLSPNNVK